MFHRWIQASLMALAVVPRVCCQNDLIPRALTNVPRCALDCFEEVIPKVPCQPSNQTCLCESPTMNQDMTVCLMAHCAVKETLVTLNVTAMSCHAPIRDRSQVYVDLSGTLGVMSGVFVVIRFAYKLWVKLEICWDDWTTLLALVCGIPNTVINVYGVPKNGLGRDVWTLPPSTITNFVRYFFVLEVIYFLEVAMLKLSLLFFYVRIFPTRWVQRLLWGTIFLCAIFGITFVVVAVFQCAPIHYYWVMWDGEHEGTCLDINAIAWSNAGISIAMDIWMLGVPLWQLKGLDLDWRRKVGVATMFCVGTLITVVSILRLRSLVKFGFDTPNPTWDFFDAGLWSTVEINVGIMCVCMPSLRLLLVRLFPKVRRTSRRYYHKYPSNTAQSNADEGGSQLPMGNIVSSKVNQSAHRPELEPNGIAYETTYSVEYDGSHDEAGMMDVKGVDGQSAKSDA